MPLISRVCRGNPYAFGDAVDVEAAPISAYNITSHDPSITEIQLAPRLSHHWAGIEEDPERWWLIDGRGLTGNMPLQDLVVELLHQQRSILPVLGRRKIVGGLRHSLEPWSIGREGFDLPRHLLDHLARRRHRHFNGRIIWQMSPHPGMVEADHRAALRHGFEVHCTKCVSQTCEQKQIGIGEALLHILPRQLA
jgi:hypothetical protein